MTRQEALLWERVLQVWAVLFCLTLLRYSGLVSNIVPSSYSLTEAALATGGMWLVAGFLSMAFLCRMRNCGEVEDLDQKQIDLRVAASVPLGVVSLVHSLYQLHHRNL